MDAIKGLITSRKALVVALAVIGCIVMNVTGRIDGSQALEFVKWVVVTWLGAHAWEEGKAKTLEATKPIVEALENQSSAPSDTNTVVVEKKSPTTPLDF